MDTLDVSEKDKSTNSAFPVKLFHKTLTIIKISLPPFKFAYVAKKNKLEYVSYEKLSNLKTLHAITNWKLFASDKQPVNDVFFFCLVPPTTKPSDNKQKIVIIVSLASFITLVAALIISYVIIKGGRICQRRWESLMDDEIQPYSIDSATDDNITGLNMSSKN